MGAGCQGGQGGLRVWVGKVNLGSSEGWASPDIGVGAGQGGVSGSGGGEGE